MIISQQSMAKTHPKYLRYMKMWITVSSISPVPIILWQSKSPKGYSNARLTARQTIRCAGEIFFSQTRRDTMVFLRVWH